VSVLGITRTRIDPDPQPGFDEPPPLSATPGEPACTCRVFDAIGQNPECDAHPWWARDTPVLDLADLTRELGSAWDAAQATFGGTK
jgi:hypothetical protein